MNIIEAVRSNKPFRRPGWLYFIQFNHSRGLYEWTPSGNSIAGDLRPEWFTYEDWEVEEKKVTITAEKLEIAFNAALRPEVLTGSFYDLLVELKKELGL